MTQRSKKRLALTCALLYGSVSLPAFSEWEPVGHGSGGNICDVVTHPTNPDVVWVVTDLTGLFRSMDGGLTYDRISGPVERQELLYEWMRGLDHELAYDPTNPEIMYWAMDGGIYTDPGLYKSTDGPCVFMESQPVPHR